MLLYHGSKNQFDKFSFNFKGLNGSSEGEGIYLTTSKKIAYNNYAGEEGYTYTVRLNEGKELSNTEITLTYEEVETVIEQLGSHEILNNYDDVDYYGEEHCMQVALDMIFSYNDNDNDIITDLCSVSGNDSKVLEVISSLGYTHTKMEASWGYDVESHEIYVVYDLDSLKILDVEKGDLVTL